MNTKGSLHISFTFDILDNFVVAVNSFIFLLFFTLYSFKSMTEAAFFNNKY